MSIVEEAQKIIDQDLKDYKVSRVTGLLRSIADKKRMLKENTKKTEEVIEKIETEIEEVEKLKDFPLQGIDSGSVFSNLNYYVTTTCGSNRIA